MCIFCVQNISYMNIHKTIFETNVVAYESTRGKKKQKKFFFSIHCFDKKTNS